MTLLELRNAMELGKSITPGKLEAPVPDEQWPRDMRGAMPTSMLELMRRFRWEQNWQGSGPFCQLNLQHEFDRQTLRECCLAMDGEHPPTSLREAYGRFGFPLGGGVTPLRPGQFSLREAGRRVLAPRSVALRFLSYNTYLLRGLEIPFGRWIDDKIGWTALDWFDIPLGKGLLALLGIASLPAVAVQTVLELAGFTPSAVIEKITGVDLNLHLGTKPAYEARGLEIGAAISPFDICCLCEVWTDDSRDRIVSELRDGNWKAVAGPDDSGAFIAGGSGLMFLAKNRNIVRTETLVYGNRGDRRHDSDAWSNKGALMNELDFGFANVEFYQTHLYYGGGIPDALQIGVLGIRDPTPGERLDVQRDELQQLANFYRDHHNPANAAIVTGDFNMSGSSLREYLEIRKIMDGLGMRDLWAWDVYANEPSDGLTCRFTDGDEAGWQRGFDAQCDFVPAKTASGVSSQISVTCDDHTLGRAKPLAGIGRYDFLFMQMPAAEQRGRVEVSRSFRRPFPRGGTTDNESYLSDHMGLDVTLFVSPT